MDLGNEALREKVDFEWVHVSYAEGEGAFREIYGFAGYKGAVNLEGVRMIPKNRPSDTLVVMMHPAAAAEFLPVPRALAASGVHVLCAGNRYFRNDTPLIFEKVALDLNAYMRHARTVWGYEKIVLLGWSGGGPLALFFQSQAENPTVTATPAGDPVDLTKAGLLPADGIIFQAANISRALLLSQCIDPSLRSEGNPEDRIVELDIYDPRNPNHPPYSADYIEHFRAEQLKRVRQKTAWVKEMLEDLKKRGGKESERGFVTHRTMADLRFLDVNVDPNDRITPCCVIGEPESANSGPAGFARFSTLRSWLSQWSVDDSNVNGLAGASAIKVPLLTINNSADEACPASDTVQIHQASGSADKTFKELKGATHYYQGQPELLEEAVKTTLDWMHERGFAS